MPDNPTDEAAILAQYSTPGLRRNNLESPANDRDNSPAAPNQPAPPEYTILVPHGSDTLHLNLPSGQTLSIPFDPAGVIIRIGFETDALAVSAPAPVDPPSGS